jgi:hypothetical protein
LRNYEVCEIWRKKSIAQVVSWKSDLVIMGSATSYPFSKTDWQQGTLEILDELQPHVAHIVLIAGTPALGFDGLNCLARIVRLSRYTPVLGNERCSPTMHTEDSLVWLEAVAKRNPQVHWLNFNELIRPHDQCGAMHANTTVYRDAVHLSVDYVHSMKPIVAKALSRY